MWQKSFIKYYVSLPVWALQHNFEKPLLFGDGEDSDTEEDTWYIAAVYELRDLGWSPSPATASLETGSSPLKDRKVQLTIPTVPNSHCCS